MPVGVIGLVAAFRLVPRLEVHAHTMDWLGVALSAVGLFLVTFGLQEGEQHDGGAIAGPVTIPVLIGAGLLVLVGFIAWQARGPEEPLIPLRIFRDRNFSLANLAITTMGLSITAMMFPMLIWLQTVRGFSPTTANRNLPIHLAGAGAGVYNTTRQVGSVTGSAAIAALMSARISAHLGPEAAEQFAGGGPEGGASTDALPAPVAEALSAGLADAMLLPAAVLVVGALAAFALEQMRHSGRPVRAGRPSCGRAPSPTT